MPKGGAGKRMIGKPASTTYAEAAVLGALLRHKTAGRKGDCGVWAYRLGREAPGVSYAAAHRILKELQEKKYVSVKEDPIGGRKRVKYVLTKNGERYAVEAIGKYLERIGVERQKRREDKRIVTAAKAGAAQREVAV